MDDAKFLGQFQIRRTRGVVNDGRWNRDCCLPCCGRVIQLINRCIMYYTFMTADRTTHMKVVAVSLIASILVVVGMLAARSSLSDMSTQLATRAPVLKAGKPLIWTRSEQIAIR